MCVRGGNKIEACPGGRHLQVCPGVGERHSGALPGGGGGGGGGGRGRGGGYLQLLSYIEMME